MQVKSTTLEEQLEQAMDHPIADLDEGDRRQVQKDITYLQRGVGTRRAIAYLASVD